MSKVVKAVTLRSHLVYLFILQKYEKTEGYVSQMSELFFYTKLLPSLVSGTHGVKVNVLKGSEKGQNIKL